MASPIKNKFNQYPDNIKPLLIDLRALILECAKQLNAGRAKESPKRLSFIMCFFNCNTKLANTFRELYTDVLKFEGIKKSSTYHF